MKPDVPPTTIVIFGASGDLARRKLLPGLFHLFHEGMLPETFAVVGYSRTELSDDEFRDHAKEAVAKYGGLEEGMWERFAERLSYVPGEFQKERDFEHLAEHLEKVEAEFGTKNRLFYCSTPPEAYPEIVRRIGEEGLEDRARIIIEKPFGEDLETARELNEIVQMVFDESQVFRIDHYLGKETVQNILVFRFANALFEPVWNRSYVDHVQLTVAEEIGIEGRGRFYERVGALRDMVQTHLLQVLTFLAMEPPPSFDPDRVRDEKVKVLRSIPPVSREQVVRGQYRRYREEKDVPPDSQVETFVALRLEIDNWRWAGVPFFLRTGKRLAERRAEAVIVFKEIPHMLFKQLGMENLEPNQLAIRIQPDEGVRLGFTVQKPGAQIELDRAALDFRYGTAFDTPLVEAYEILLLEAMRGDHMLFTRQDGVERAWAILQPILDAPPTTSEYEPGSWGPGEAEELISPRRWIVS
ncbi:MAG TPA: glucose-6-phosphate dehydrogenase [Actinomycetota bacterium]|nr:glucose-6-phosphate dehydrogenase [Actinomycetota bacterium]